jgi:hypothetical protein
MKIACTSMICFFHRSIENADFNVFARHAKIADHPFSVIALAELVQFLMK